MTDSENIQDVFEYYLANMTDVESLKNIVHGNYAADGNISIPPGSIIYSGSSGVIPYGAGGGSYTITSPNVNNVNWVTENYGPLLQPVDIEALAEKITTRYIPGNPLVICIDNEFTSAQADEIKEYLIRHNIPGHIIMGAKAGTGRPKGNVTDEGKRIDILARLAETWERHPDLTFAELIRWWDGKNMTDDDFAAATDVYTKKVYE